MCQTQIVDKMFHELEKSIESVKTLHDIRMYSSTECFNKMREYQDKYMCTLNNLLLFNVICKEVHEYGYSLIEKIDCKLW